LRAVIEFLVRKRRWRVSRLALGVLGVDFPASVKVGDQLYLAHGSQGSVIHGSTVIGDRVRIFQQVTVGRKDAHVGDKATDFDRVEIGNDVVLFAGAKVLGGAGITRVGAGTLVAANAVLLQSTGENEVWAGMPARKIGDRDPFVGALPPSVMNATGSSPLL